MSTRTTAGFADRLRDKARACIGLTKPRITALVVAVAAASFVLARGPASRLAATLAATTLLATGIFALNEYLERGVDGLMARTRGRALPSRRLSPAAALALGSGLAAAGLVALTLAVSPLSAAVGLLTLVSYLFVYTPLKPTTLFHTAIGAVSGATPPLLGWAAATGGLSPAAWALAGIVLLWQIPHLLAIETVYRDDYARAGLRVLPVVDRGGRLTRVHVLAPIALLAPISLLPAITALARPAYAAIAAALALAFFWFGWKAARGGAGEARTLQRASVAYLPLLFGALLLLRV